MINKEPFIEVNYPKQACWEGWQSIGAELGQAIRALDKSKVVVAVDCFQGTYTDINLQALKDVLSPQATIQARDLYRSEREIRQLVAQDLDFRTGSARVSTLRIDDYFDPEKLAGICESLDSLQGGVILIHGTGASQITTADLTIYSDISRWEILQRFRRNDISNLAVCNEADSFDRQYQWGYFIDWRICDKIKKQVIGSAHYFMEANNWQKPKLALGDAVRSGFEQATRQPIFMAPFFDPELWDQESIHELNQEDFEWGFNCDIEEDNILFRISDSLFETPAINLVYHQAARLLGPAVYRKFGSEVPVKLNFVDGTEDGNQLSFDVYPGADHLMDHFGLRYQQVENYYIMNAKKKARMYVNLKEEASAAAFKQAIDTQMTSEVAALLDSVNLDKHDHLAIPQETIHSNGHQAIMLHISTAPQIFKSALYRDKDATPRHLPRHEVLINEISRKGHYQLVKNAYVRAEGELHEEVLAPEENTQVTISRIWFERELTLETKGVFNMFNLIDGKEIIIEGVTGEFKPFTVHYAETFFIPASIGQFIIKSSGKSKTGLLRVVPGV